MLSPAGDLHLQPVKLHEDWRTTGLVDLVLVAVKMYDLERGRASVKPLLADDTAVVPFQNGVEAQAILERALGRRACLRRCRLHRRRHRGARASSATPAACARLVFGEPYPTSPGGSRRWRRPAAEPGSTACCRPRSQSRSGASSCSWHHSPASPASAGPRSAPSVRIRCCGAGSEPLVEEAAAVARARGVALPPGRGGAAPRPRPQAADRDAARRCSTTWRPAVGWSWTG